MDLYTILGYFTALQFIRPNLEPSILFSTAILIHVTDALLCLAVAAHSGRRRGVWTLAGLFLGLWALATLFLLNDIEKRRKVV
ncbi:MAG: hypothetical protein HY695_09700 [Deltaproteobacteria bacterium]|nr:hypothetical protein [Deltaproteobacteria bacterium]